MDKMDKILSILKESNNLIDYTKETALITDALLDSLELMEIISELEDAFAAWKKSSPKTSTVQKPS